MPVLDTDNAKLRSLRGVHLWHAGLSSCSQRVRMTLAELDQDFESHPVNLEAGENTSEWYQAIHPNGVVPALVHDGRLVIESVDIIDYLDRTLGQRKLALDSGIDADLMRGLVQRADRGQIHLKTLTYEFIFSTKPASSDEQQLEYQKNQKNKALREFHRDFHTGFGRQRIVASATAIDKDLRFIEQRLADGREFLAGSAFSLADIAWIPNFHRFDIIGWPFERYPRLQRWFRGVSSRASYGPALLDWEPPELLEFIAPKLSARRAAGDGIESYLS